MFDSILLTKLFTTLAYPAGLLLVFTVLSKLFVWTRRNALASICKFSFWVVLILSTNPIFANWLISSLEQQYPQAQMAKIERHDAIIVLGGGLKVPLPPIKRSQLSSASDRYWYAAQLYKANKADKLFLAGGNVFEQRDQGGRVLCGEAHFARELLIEWGVSADHIIIEDDSRTTRQNRTNISTMIDQHKVEGVLLVTSATHMPRAYRLFRDIAEKVTPAPADILITRSHRPAVLRWLPSATAFSMTTLALHEYYGLSVLYVTDFFTQGSE